MQIGRGEREGDAVNVSFTPDRGRAASDHRPSRDVQEVVTAAYPPTESGGLPVLREFESDGAGVCAADTERAAVANRGEGERHACLSKSGSKTPCASEKLSKLTPPPAPRPPEGRI